ncbi:MAG: indolepyruvate ferredoxin oxidoreductase family protein [Sphingomonadales bacterium]
MGLATVTLEDKYTLDSGRVYLSGIQALVRLPLMQRRRDIEAGLNTAGFISGYRGSPLGGFDASLWRAKQHLEDHHIRFLPAVNEDLAATSVWGTQQVNSFPGARYDGVFAAWYGKGPGVDRSGDPLKHGNFAGSSKNGGVLVFFGDDHGCKSSTTAHQSEHAMIAAMIPVFNPATVQDYLDLGLFGWAMSRYSGLWAGFKCVSETVESSASCHVDPGRVAIVAPDDFEMPLGGLNLRLAEPNLAFQEERVIRYRLPAAQAFVRANRLDRVVLPGGKGGLGIVTAGKAYLDVRQALSDLGIDRARAEALGIGVYKLAMTWPVEPQGLRAFADGFKELLVIEEKRPVIEEQAASLLFNIDAAERPRLVGKADETGAPLLPSHGEIDPAMVARAITARLKATGAWDERLTQDLERLEIKLRHSAPSSTPGVVRLPYFCSGCPHNSSTRVPDGSMALAGIGCHAMALWMPDRPTALPTQMGGEGANWIGMSSFTSMPHIFQNLGDGTYFHSGITGIRAAVAAKANITFKILFNDAVAMTGGQPIDGELTVPEITQQVHAEGVTKIIVVTDEPDKYPNNAGFAPGVTVRRREELDQVQRQLRELPGTTIMIYDQTCAAEKRRRRKRGLFPDPDQRLFINEAVCEGCGDCSDKSNCVSVQPLETEFGRKRMIDQSNCNKDFSCVQGFCPSFATVQGGALRKHALPASAVGAAAPFANLPDPTIKPLDRPYGILITGIGGSGVVTVSALMGMAAHIEGKGCSVQDMTGLAQKNGAVVSHVRLAPKPEDLSTVRLGTAEADLLLGCDLIVAGGPDALQRVGAGRTNAIVNSHVTPTASFQSDPDADFQGAAFMKTIAEATGQGHSAFVEATRLATALMGDAIATNVFMLGYAFQMGYVPLSREAIEAAIELNGVTIAANLQTFNWGRLAAHDPEAVEKVAGLQSADDDTQAFARTLEEIVDIRVAELERYQDADYARAYSEFIARVAAEEAARANDRTDLSESVARNLFKLMAYKDEYEVARLYSEPGFRERLNNQFEGDFKLRIHLAPPLLSRPDPVTGVPEKTSFGPWMFTAFKLLVRFKRLRGGMLDPFGHTTERKAERQMIQDYRKLIEQVLEDLSPENHALALMIAGIPEQIRGFGHIKLASMEKARTRRKKLLARYQATRAPARAAE